jgi:hypothetical protein
LHNIERRIVTANSTTNIKIKMEAIDIIVLVIFVPVSEYMVIIRKTKVIIDPYSGNIMPTTVTNVPYRAINIASFRIWSFIRLDLPVNKIKRKKINSDSQ